MWFPSELCWSNNKQVSVWSYRPEGYVKWHQGFHDIVYFHGCNIQGWLQIMSYEWCNCSSVLTSLLCGPSSVPVSSHRQQKSLPVQRAHLVSLVAVCWRNSSRSWSDCSGRMFFSSSSLFDGRLLSLIARESFLKTFMARVPSEKRTPDSTFYTAFFRHIQTNQLQILELKTLVFPEAQQNSKMMDDM